MKQLRRIMILRDQYITPNETGWSTELSAVTQALPEGESHLSIETAQAPDRHR